MQVLIYEDRVTDLIGVELAALSLRRFHPEAELLVKCPGAPTRFADWFEANGIGTLDRSPASGRALGWNVKPTLLLERLTNSAQAVVWHDSDIISTGEWLSLTEADEDTLVATEETPFGQAQGGAHRAVAWGLKPGRSLMTTINSGVLRVTRSHTRLLERWAELLDTEQYRQVQGLPWAQRPLHMIGDQEVLTALLGSAEFQDVSLRQLRQGREIAQCFGPAGLRPVDRLRAIATGFFPPLVHAMGIKPWQALGRLDRRASPDGGTSSFKARLRQRYDQAHLLTSPYVQAARP